VTRAPRAPRRIRTLLFGLILLAAIVPALSASAAKPSGQISLSTSGTRPSGTVVVTGVSGFSNGETVDLYFDSADQGIATATTGGRFPATGLQVPTRAVPGTHWITAQGRQSGRTAQVPITIRTDWTSGGFDAMRGGWNVFENVVDSTNVSGLTEAWTAQTGNAAHTSPAVAGGSVYVGSSNGKLYAFDANCSSNCSPRWTGTAGGPIDSSPAVSGSTVYVGSDDGKLYAFDTGCSGNCAPKWTATTGGPIDSSPAVSGGLVYVGSADKKLYAFPVSCTATPCAPSWTAPAGGTVHSSPSVGFVKALGATVVAIGANSGQITVVNATTGVRIWAQTLSAGLDATPTFASEVVKDKEMLYAVTDDGNLNALVASDGTLLWHATLGSAVHAPPTVAGSRLFVGADDGLLYAFNAAGCKDVAGQACDPIWTAGTTGMPYVRAAPTAGDGLVYVGRVDGSLSAYDAAGCKASSCPAARWTTEVGPIASAPALANGSLYVTSGDSELHALALPSVPKPPPAPNPTALQPFSSPIRHVVVIFQENHSFDEVLGQICVQDARCDGADTGVLPDGASVPLTRSPDVVPEVGHNVQAHQLAINGGAMNGWANVGGCSQAKGYRCFTQYYPDQIPNLADAARSFTISDRTFESDPTASFGAHIDMAATSLGGFTGDIPAPDPNVETGPGWGCDSQLLANWRSSPPSSIQRVPSCIPKQDGTGPYRPSPVSYEPTVMDRLDAANLSWRIYEGEYLWSNQNVWSMCPSFGDCLYGAKSANVAPAQQLVDDANAGNLPNLTFAMPFPGTGPHAGTSQHNGTSMIRGDNKIGELLNGLMNGPEWNSTAVFITYDDCGCFYDHVPPPAGLGVRVPMVIVSPYAKPGFTDSNIASFSSVIAYVERTYGNLPPLSTRDQDAYAYAQSFNYNQAPLAPIQTTQTQMPAASVRYLSNHPEQPEGT
jgi:outer membrane protein assembly factor BamB